MLWLPLNNFTVFDFVQQIVAKFVMFLYLRQNFSSSDICGILTGFVHLSKYKIPCHFHAFSGHLKKIQDHANTVVAFLQDI